MDKKLLLNIVEDRYRKFQNDYAVVSTDFLDLNEQSLVMPFVKSHAKEGVFLYGGFEDAERKQVVFVPDYTMICGEEELFHYFKENPEQCPLRVIDVVAGKKDASLRHSDYLGALMSLGIKREKMGDILVLEEGAQIVVNEEIASYLAQNYVAVGKTPISTKVLTIDKLKKSSIKKERQKFTVASPRLDNIVSAAFGISRKTAVEAVSRGIVFVNSIETKKPDYMLKGGEKVVLRGKGKVVYRGATGTSRKGKAYVELDKYL